MTRLGRPVHGRAVRDYLLVDTRTLGPAAMSDDTVRITRNASFSAFSPSPSISDRTLATFLTVYCSDTGRVQLMVALSIEGRLGQGCHHLPPGDTDAWRDGSKLSAGAGKQSGLSALRSLWHWLVCSPTSRQTARHGQRHGQRQEVGYAICVDFIHCSQYYDDAPLTDAGWGLGKRKLAPGVAGGSYPALVPPGERRHAPPPGSPCGRSPSPWAPSLNHGCSFLRRLGPVAVAAPSPRGGQTLSWPRAAPRVPSLSGGTESGSAGEA